VSRAFIAFGSNLGDRLANLQQAARLLRDHAGVEFVRASEIYETDPVGRVDQGRFLNAAAEVETTLSPRALLNLLLSIERELGRDRGRDRGAGERWGPRAIDLDLLLYDDAEIDEPGLTLPHPRMHERLFVLVPLADIAPERVVESNVDTLKRDPAQRIERMGSAILLREDTPDPAVSEGQDGCSIER